MEVEGINSNRDSNRVQEIDHNSHTVAVETELGRQERGQIVRQASQGGGRTTGRGKGSCQRPPPVDHSLSRSRRVRRRISVDAPLAGTDVRGVDVANCVDADGSEKQPPIPVVGKRTSWVWNEFDIKKITNKDTQVTTLHAECIHCRDTWYRAEGVYGTSNLKRHLATCPQYLEWLKNNGGNDEFIRKQYCKLFVEAILKHGYPLSMAEHDGTRSLHAYLNHEVVPISRHTITRWCVKKHEKLKDILVNSFSQLSSKVSLTCDVWTACTSCAYLTLTVHYIDNAWCLRSKVLNFRHFPPPHTGLETYTLVYELIKEWGLEKKVTCMTVDNASSMDAMISRLRHALNIHSPLPSSGKHFHVRCCAHILNLIVKEGLGVIDHSFNLVRENVKYIDSSESRFNRFRDCASISPADFTLKLWLDVPTRWNSTFIMLLRALKYQQALQLFGEMEHDYPYRMCSSDWEAVQKICTLLEPFAAITNLFSGTEYPTANLYLEQICKIQFHLSRACESVDDNIRQMANLMFEKFDKYWSKASLLLSIATVFDPRHKFAFLKHNYSYIYENDETVDQKLALVKSELVQLFNFYKGPLDCSQESSRSSISLIRRPDADSFQSFDSFADVGFRTGEKSELETYLDLPLFNTGGAKFDLLVWWKEHQHHYPIMATIAKDILAIPITTVASESSFSMGGRILNKFRSCLTDKNVEALVTTKNWMYGYECYDDADNCGINVEESTPDAESHAFGGDCPSPSAST